MEITLEDKIAAGNAMNLIASECWEGLSPEDKLKNMAEVIAFAYQNKRLIEKNGLGIKIGD